MARIAFLGIVYAISAQLSAQNPPLASLKTVPPPKPVGTDHFVRDGSALIALDKALFWDMQACSDGRTACATCHFHAGADHRAHHQLSGPDAEMNRLLTTGDFPFRRFANNNRSALTCYRSQVAGSMGVVTPDFLEAQPSSDIDVSCAATLAPAFHSGTVALRQVTGRNSPSVINAVYSLRNFWDGSASDIFTGATPFGDSDSNFHALVYRNGRLECEAFRIVNASLASQAVGPALNAVEMSWAGRAWPHLGCKLLSLPPLARQKVATTDSVLGHMAKLRPRSYLVRPRAASASLGRVEAPARSSDSVGSPVASWTLPAHRFLAPASIFSGTVATSLTGSKPMSTVTSGRGACQQAFIEC